MKYVWSMLGARGTRYHAFSEYDTNGLAAASMCESGVIVSPRKNRFVTDKEIGDDYCRNCAKRINFVGKVELKIVS